MTSAVVKWLERLLRSRYTWDLFPHLVISMIIKTVSKVFMLDAHHQGDSAKEKPVSLLVVPLSKALTGIAYLQFYVAVR